MKGGLFHRGTVQILHHIKIYGDGGSSRVEDKSIPSKNRPNITSSKNKGGWGSSRVGGWGVTSETKIISTIQYY